MWIEDKGKKRKRNYPESYYSTVLAENMRAQRRAAARLASEVYLRDIKEFEEELEKIEDREEDRRRKKRARTEEYWTREMEDREEMLALTLARRKKAEATKRPESEAMPMRSTVRVLAPPPPISPSPLREEKPVARFVRTQERRYPEGYLEEYEAEGIKRYDEIRNPERYKRLPLPESYEAYPPLVDEKEAEMEAISYLESLDATGPRTEEESERLSPLPVQVAPDDWTDRIYLEAVEKERRAAELRTENRRESVFRRMALFSDLLRVPYAPPMKEAPNSIADFGDRIRRRYRSAGEALATAKAGYDYATNRDFYEMLENYLAHVYRDRTI